MAEVYCKILMGESKGYIPFIQFVSPILGDLNEKWFRVHPEAEGMDYEYPTYSHAKNAAVRKVGKLMGLIERKELLAGVHKKPTIAVQDTKPKVKKAEDKWQRYLDEKKYQAKKQSLREKLRGGR
jgi:hypothetical protein